MIRVTTALNEARSKLAKIQAVAQTGAFDQPVEIAAWKTQRGLVSETPKKWTGITRREWQVVKAGVGTRIVKNDSKVMLFLEEGTGLTTGGWVYPKSKKYLFIPLTSTASLTGWHKGLVMGRDYRLSKRVRGIRAMHIVRNFRPKAAEILKAEMKAFLERALK